MIPCYVFRLGLHPDLGCKGPCVTLPLVFEQLGPFTVCIIGSPVARRPLEIATGYLNYSVGSQDWLQINKIIYFWCLVFLLSCHIIL